jgi:N-methylhydantoinase A
VLGHIDAARISGGVTLDASAAHRAVEALAQRLSAPADRVALAIIAAVDAAMARALRRVSVERGVDPRRCALVAFGGGGPLHACALATQLGMTRILVPPHAGVLSALGLAIAGERRDVMRSVMRPADQIDRAAVAAMCEELATRAGAGAERRWWVHARYVGQGHELDVPVNPDDDGGTIASRFATLHSARAGFKLERPVEIVSLRHATFGAAREAHLARSKEGDVPAPVRGPAVVPLPDAAMRVDTGWSAVALNTGGYLMERAK